MQNDIKKAITITDTDVYEHVDGLLTTAIDDDLIIVPNDASGDLFGLNDTGNFIWQKLDGSSTVAAIIKELVMIYDVSEETCKDEVYQFIHHLYSQDVIQLTEKQT